MTQEEKKLPEGLEKAAGEYAVDNAQYYYEDDDNAICSTADILKPAFIAGAEWWKDKMLEEAKDGYVSAIIIHNDGDEEHYAVTYPNGERPHSITDKVKIIIL